MSGPRHWIERSLSAIADADAVAAYYAERARFYAESPPEANWDRITNLTEK